MEVSKSWFINYYKIHRDGHPGKSGNSEKEGKRQIELIIVVVDGSGIRSIVVREDYVE